jgi:hypothetical protein
LAASLGEPDITDRHKSLAALHHDLEWRSQTAIDQKYSGFKISSSFAPPDRGCPPESARRYLGARHFDELARTEPGYAVIGIAVLICRIYRVRGMQNADVANITTASQSDLLDICRWYAAADANRLAESVRKYIEERANQQVRSRSDWANAKAHFFNGMSDEAKVLGVTAKHLA